MDQHSNSSRFNGGSHTKLYTNTAHLHGIGVPTIMHNRLPHNINETNSNHDVNIMKDEYKATKAHTYHPGVNSYNKLHYSGGNKVELTSSGSINTSKLNTTSSFGNSPTTLKTMPSFLQNRNQMKGSLFMGEAENAIKSSKNDGHFGQDKHYRRPPRMSEQPDMKFSAIQFGNDNHKVPSFLHQKGERKQKRIPYHNDGQRPQSSKQSTIKTQFPPESLSSSYGTMKKSKLDYDPSAEQIDPAQQWIKKSWNKKKQKKITINDFEQIKDLGSGKYGQVYLAKQKKTNFICALKIIEKRLLKQQEITEQFIRELKVQSFLNHPNIIRMYGFFDDHVNIYIILEVGTGGQLFKQLKKHQSMPQHKVAGIMRQVCQAVSELHSNHIIHRDIKPQNIVLSQNVIKLCDFGWSVYAGQTLRNTFCGTPLYVGPQILKGKQYNQKIDIWSLGVMMYQMLVGQNPFKITKEEQLIKIIKDQIKIPNYVELSHEAKNFVMLCLQKNPEDRPSIRQLLAHDFFKKYPEKSDKKVAL